MAKSKNLAKSKNVRDHASELADQIAPHVETARKKAGPLLAEAKDKAGPLLAEARDKSGPVISDARDRLASDVLPRLNAALAAVEEATEDVRAEAKRRSKATAAAVKGEVDAPKKKHRLRSMLIVLGLGGLAAAVAKQLSDRQPSTAWQSAYTPPPAPSAPAHVDDEAAAAPDEAAADAARAPHTATTPENPAEEVHLKKD
jgi:hypothetical protein